MLSYQHGFHAGNAADVHKHAALCIALNYLTQKDKALSYLETHAGRGLYDLTGPQATKTGESSEGIARLLHRFDDDHPYPRTIAAMRAELGPTSYPGSPLIAAHLLRAFDRLDLAELHPAEFEHLTDAMPRHPNIRLHKRDGFELAKALTPPDPRRGLMLIDPSWEVRSDYDRMTQVLPMLHRKWGVGVLMLWYPLLADRRHRPMTRALQDVLPEIILHEVRFPPARAGHGMEGSGLAIVNAPWGLTQALPTLTAIFEEA